MALNVLSREEIEKYKCNGYLVPKTKLSEVDVDKLQRLTLQLVADNPQARGGIRGPHLADGSSKSFERQAGWLDIATNPKLLDIIEELIGPDIILWASTLLCKSLLEAGTPWHRDGRYYPIRPLTNITAWIAVFDVLRENAALRFIPGSHVCRPMDADGANEPGTDGRLHLSEKEEGTAVDVELEAGQMVVFDVSTVHGSWPNLSSCERYGYSVRYFPATSLYDRSCATVLARSRELILVRGQNRAGNRLAPLVDANHP